MFGSSLPTTNEGASPPKRVSKSLYVPALPNILVVLSSVLFTTPPLFYLIVKGCRGFVTELHNRPCISDGSSISELFSINMAFGKYGFATVKLIDTIWDIGVGRGLQIALAAGALTVYKMALMRAMESYTMSYNLFLATRVQQGTFSICSSLLHELIRRWKTQSRPLHVKAILATILVTTAYIGVWPTLTSAMTGYTPLFTIMVAACDGSAMPTGYYSTSRIIYDGQRISLPADMRTQFSNNTSSGTTLWNNTVLTPSVIMTNFTTWNVSLASYDCEANSGIVDPPSGIRVDVDLYMETFYKNGKYPINGSVEPSVLVINGTNVDIKAPILNISTQVYEYKNKAYSLGYREKNQICQPTNAYQWGVSYYLAVSWSICNFLFVSLLYGLWIDAWRNSRVVQARCKTGIYRALLDLGCALQEELGKENAEKDMEQELTTKLSKAIGGLVVPQNEERVVGSLAHAINEKRRDKGDEYIGSSRDDLLAQEITLHFFIEA